MIIWLGPNAPNLMVMSRNAPLSSEVHMVGTEALLIFYARYWWNFSFSIAMGSWMARGGSRFVVNSEGIMPFTDAAMAASNQIFSISKFGNR